ncbi:hypothetical protein ACFGOO_01730 [Treponema vincentii]|uniref:hypothetical protein n=1 Tax=Treponema vincentii TaxID=69710 RepID=UPI0035F5FBB2
MLRKSMAEDGGKATAFAPSSSPPGGIHWAGFLFTEGSGTLSGIFKNFRRCIIVHP